MIGALSAYPCLAVLFYLKSPFNPSHLYEVLGYSRAHGQLYVSDYGLLCPRYILDNECWQMFV